MVLRAEAILPGWGVRAIRRVIRWVKEYPLAMFRPAWSRPGAPARFFTFRGKQYRYFYHRYNQTWKNERAVEIPIAEELVSEHRGRSILEVGNVLSHYCPVEHEVLDRYERGPGVINLDIMDYHPDKTFDLIVTISTLEHVGWEDMERDTGKGLLAFRHLAGMLAPGGLLMATLPVWINEDIIRFATAGDIPFDELYGFVRSGDDNEWKQVDPDTARETPMGGTMMSPVNAFLIGYYYADSPGG
jgi:hypothetical protein